MNGLATADQPLCYSIHAYLIDQKLKQRQRDRQLRQQEYGTVQHQGRYHGRNC